MPVLHDLDQGGRVAYVPPALPDYPTELRPAVRIVQACVWPLRANGAHLPEDALDRHARYVGSFQEVRDALNMGWGCHLILGYIDRPDKVRAVRNADSHGDRTESLMRLFQTPEGAWVLQRVSTSRKLIEQWPVVEMGGAA